MASQRPPRSPANGLPPNWEKDLTEQFRQVLSTQRMRELSSRSIHRALSPRRDAPRSTASPSPAHQTLRHGSGGRNFSDSPANIDHFALGARGSTRSSLQNIPLMPSPPSDLTSQQFRSQLHILSEVPRKWENPGLLDEAMKEVPLEKIYDEASEESMTLQATAESINKKPAWAYQDCVIRALLRWFKASFFTWVNNPPCSRCRGPTIAKGVVAPTPEEKAYGGNRVELYQCSLQTCASHERFPRYSDAFVLLRTRRGRLGEWVNCFGMLCRAMGSRVRWVWNSEDHVWLEVYSEYRRRWIHVDSCEAAFDKPLIYNEGWNKKLAYCIAFSADGAMDVTRRYCRNPGRFALERSKCSESSLLYILDEIRQMRRRDMSKDEKFKLEGEDMREMKELRHYYVSTITTEIARLVPPRVAFTAAASTHPQMTTRDPAKQQQQDADAQKLAEARQQREEAEAEQRRLYGEDTGSDPHNRHDARGQ